MRGSNTSLLHIITLTLNTKTDKVDHKTLNSKKTKKLKSPTSRERFVTISIGQRRVGSENNLFFSLRI